MMQGLWRLRLRVSIGVVVVSGVVALGALGLGTRAGVASSQAVPASASAGQPGPKAGALPTPAKPAAVRFPVVLHLPAGLGTLDSGLRNITGEPIGIKCSTCHTLHAEPPFIQKASDLKRFHKDLKFTHGELACGACHDREDRDKLRMADDRRIPMQDVMVLCSQCHGPQARDWRHGAHGGMSGYWDLTRGGRVRNTCVDCHDPHQPKYPTFAPVHPPKDRFLEPVDHNSADAGSRH
jgi:hypothetical protein